MQERLDDAIDILKEHAEGQLYPHAANHNHVVSRRSTAPLASPSRPRATPRQPSPDAKMAHLLPKESGKKGKKGEKAPAGKAPAKKRGR